MRVVVFASVLAVVFMALASVPFGALEQPVDAAAPEATVVHITDKKANVNVQTADAVSYEKVLSLLDRSGIHPKFSSESAGILTIKSKDASDTLIRELSAIAGVQGISSELKARALFTPDDQNFNVQWGMTTIDAPQAWDITRGEHTVVIGELDTGIDWNHPDLAGNMWTSSRGYHGFDFINDTNFPMDDNINSFADNGLWQPNTYTYHGTHVAGTLGAVINNQIGIAGMAQSQLMAVKVMNDSGEGTDATVAAGLRWAVDNGADIITMSLGVDGVSTVLQSAVDYASSQGVVMVAASGNSGSSFVSYPAAYPEVIAVGAIDNSDRRASFSNWGPGLDMMAPGIQIYSTQGSSSYQYLSGTSTAAPFVAGTAALMLSVNPALTPAEVGDALNSTATDLSITGYDTTTGWGVVNAFRAVASIAGPTATFTTYPSYIPPNSTYSITWIVTGGNPGTISDTYLTWGTSASSLTGESQHFTGTTIATYTVNNLQVPANGTLYFIAYATVDGTQYRSDLLSIPIREAPPTGFAQFIHEVRNFIFNDVGVVNFALLMIGLIAIPAIVIAARSRRRRVVTEPMYVYAPPRTIQETQTRYIPPPPPPPPRYEAHVDVLGHDVAPSIIRVVEGTRIVWVNRAWAPPPGISIKSGKLDETGEHPDGAFSSGLLIAPGDYWSATFHKIGTYEYYLTGIWKTARIVVEPYAPNTLPNTQAA